MSEEITLGKKTYKSREEARNVLRRLPQFRGSTDERLDTYIDAKLGGRDTQEALASRDQHLASNIEATLSVELQPYFRTSVKKLLDEVVRVGGNREIMRDPVEEAVYAGILLRQKLIASKDLKGDLDERGIKEMFDTRIGLLEKLGVTPKELRIGGIKPNETLSAAIFRSRESARKVRDEGKALQDEEKRLLGDRA